MNQEYADKYQRSYQSIQALIANIGGVSNLVFIVIKMKISYIDSIIYRFMKNSQKGKIMENYARLVQKNLNVITLIKLCLYYHKLKDKKCKEDNDYNKKNILLSIDGKNNSSMYKELNIKQDI